MSLIAINTHETAAQLLARLQALDVEIETGRNKSTHIAYSANGLILRQQETVVTTEYVGLTKAAAHKLEDLDDDTTTSTIHYKKLGDNNDYAAVAITTGTKTDYVPTRADADDCWKVTKTVTTYAAASDDGWSTTRPGVSQNGIEISRTRSKTFVAKDAFGASYYQNCESVVTEYPFLTEAESKDMVSQKATGTAVTYDVQCVASWSTTEGIKSWFNIQLRSGGYGHNIVGTDAVPTRRYEGIERGWVVSVTETKYWTTAS